MGQKDDKDNCNTAIMPESLPHGAGLPPGQVPVIGPEVLADAAEKAKLIQKAQEVLYHTPEARPDKVARVKEALAQGTYKIEARKVANALLTEHLPPSKTKD
jgi:hypothetical protein